MYKLIFLVLSIGLFGCNRQPHLSIANPAAVAVGQDYAPVKEEPDIAGKEALLLTGFKSLAEFESIIEVEYVEDSSGADSLERRCEVRLIQHTGGKEMHSILDSGVSEGDFLRARDGGLWDKIRLVFISPYALIHWKDLLRIEFLGRRRGRMFGEGDVAFYDLAETMVFNIRDDDYISMPTQDLSEKGYLNTFNHVTAQAFMTSIFSERMADFVADVHERYHTPELITGAFTPEQMQDLEDGPLDNYLDMINNEWGQELGKQLAKKYHIDHKTIWTPQLMADYLNDVQRFHSWAFQIAFKPFKPTDVTVIRFADKVNRVMGDVDALRRYYG